MFTIKGEYYCINGCLKYPISNEKVFNLIHCLASSCIVEEAKYYKIEPDNFNVCILGLNPSPFRRNL